MNKLYLIIITHVLNVQIDTLKSHMGYESMVAAKTINLLEAQYIEQGVCIGKSGDNLLIVDPNHVLQFYDAHVSSYENNICQLFPKSEIVVLNLNSVVDMYGYSIIRRGKRVRTKWEADSDIYIDEGGRVIEEKDNAELVPTKLLTKYLGKESNWKGITLTEYK